MNKLAQDALQSLLAQQPLAITHPAGWVRGGFPLPLKRMKPDSAGVVTQDYRPLAILEHINDVLSGAAAARRLRFTQRTQEINDANLPLSPLIRALAAIKFNPQACIEQVFLRH